MITSNSSPSEITQQVRCTEHVFNRFDINPYNKNKVLDNTVLTEVNPDFLVDILNVFCKYKELDSCCFEMYPVPVILDYLKRSHAYYMEKILPEIGQSISILLCNYPKSHPLLEILYKFYFNYKVDLKEHFSEEEEILFSYAESLYKAKYFKNEIFFFVDFLQKYSINDFIDSHSDTLEGLENVKHILLQYNPPVTNKSSFRMLVGKLENLEHDLRIHAYIEDEILVPKLYLMEKSLKLEFSN